MNCEQRHGAYLHNLVYHLDYVGIPKQDVNFVIQEPQWFQGRSNDQHTLCDLIIGHLDGSMTALELKGNKAKRQKARMQIEAGREFIECELKAEYRQGIFAVYLEHKKYHWEII
jgi:hypothetical protein